MPLGSVSSGTLGAFILTAFATAFCRGEIFSSPDNPHCIEPGPVEDGAADEIVELSSVSDVESCRHVCQTEPGCVAAVYRTDAKTCSLRTSLQMDPSDPVDQNALIVGRYCVPLDDENLSILYRGHKYHFGRVSVAGAPFNPAFCDRIQDSYILELNDPDEMDFMQTVIEGLAEELGWAETPEFFLGLAANGSSWISGKALSSPNWCNASHPPDTGPFVMAGDDLCWSAVNGSQDTAATICELPSACQPPPNPDSEKGEFVCEDPGHVLNSTCNFRCNGHQLVPNQISTILCSRDDAFGDMTWLADPSTIRCVPTAALLVGGIGTDYRTQRMSEVFSPTDPPAECHGDFLDMFPVPVQGAVAGLVDGVGVVCGGAADAYTDCRNTAGDTRICDRNAQYVKTAGGARWYSGPKTSACYMYDHDFTKKWIKVADLKFPRSHASSVVLPDGRLWILGGIGEEEMLDSTEIVQRNPYSQEFVVLPGLAKLKQKIFGHCTAIAQNQVFLTGGYDGDDYTNRVDVYDLDEGKWTTQALTLNDPRMDHGCLALEVRGQETVMVAGGWNKDGHITASEFVELSTKSWRKQGKTVRRTLEVNKGHVRRSGSLLAGGDGRGPIMIGGVACGKTSASATECARLNSAVEFYADPAASDSDEWRLLQDGRSMSVGRSSFAMLVMPESYLCPVDTTTSMTPAAGP